MNWRANCQFQFRKKTWPATVWNALADQLTHRPTISRQFLGPLCRLRQLHIKYPWQMVIFNSYNMPLGRLLDDTSLFDVLIGHYAHFRTWHDKRHKKTIQSWIGILYNYNTTLLIQWKTSTLLCRVKNRFQTIVSLVHLELNLGDIWPISFDSTAI